MFIKLRKLLIAVVHTDDTEGHGGPQAEGVGERESSEIKRKLNGGPQADEVSGLKISELAQGVTSKITFYSYRTCRNVCPLLPLLK